MAPQRIVPVLVDGQPSNVIAFDPAKDFTVLSWLEDHHPGPIGTGDVIVGGRLPGQPGQMLSLCGKPLGIYGRLGKTGVGPFDESYFLTFAALADLVAFCRGSGSKAEDPTGVAGWRSRSSMPGRMSARLTFNPTGFRRFCCSSRLERRPRKSSLRWLSFQTSKSSRPTMS